MKTIALDARVTRRWSVGMRAYARELCARLPHIAPEFRFEALHEGTNFGWDEQVGVPRRIRASGAALTHYLSLYAPAVAPRPYVVTIHDLIHLRFPQYFKRSVRPYYATVTRLLCARAARIVVDDERTVDDLARFLGASREKARVVPLGVDDVFLRGVAPFEPPRPYLLYVGNHREHKNLATLFAAWQSLEHDVDLYLTGDADIAVPEISAAGRRLVFLGNVSDERLAGYYAGACALVHPALCEGFGLPMLEAMAAGCPVVASTDAVPAVLAPAAQTFASTSVREAGTAIGRVLDDARLREEMIAHGRRLAEGLTWDRCAERTADVYREVLRENAA